MNAFEQARYGIDSYQDWLEAESLEVVEGLAIDCTQVETSEWPRAGRARVDREKRRGRCARRDTGGAFRRDPAAGKLTRRERRRLMNGVARASGGVADFKSQALHIHGVIVIEPRKLADARGFFMETYSAPAFRDLGIDRVFVQDNQSLSRRRGTIRGLHFQIPPHAQAKLVRVLRGSTFDVAVDLRRESPSYGKWCAARLTAAGGEQIFVPRGFAHGFCTLEPDVEVAYKVDEVYAPEYDRGLVWNDPTLGIGWPLPADEILVSEKDAALARFAGFSSPFTASTTGGS